MISPPAPAHWGILVVVDNLLNSIVLCLIYLGELAVRNRKKPPFQLPLFSHDLAVGLTLPVSPVHRAILSVVICPIAYEVDLWRTLRSK